MTEYVNKSPYKLGQFGEQLENMTEQQVFNIACEHLLLQDKKSIEIDCMYKGGGVCCAAAPFIKDYNKEMESRNWEVIAHTSNCINLLNSLQSVHDDFEVQFWAEELIFLGKSLNLALPQILIEKLQGDQL